MKILIYVIAVFFIFFGFTIVVNSYRKDFDMAGIVIGFLIATIPTIFIDFLLTHAAF